MKRIKLAMVRDHLNDLPQYELPEGYGFRLYEPGDEAHWADIEALAEEFPSREAALERFRLVFGQQLEALQQRGVFLIHPTGRPIGTTTAWWGDTFGEPMGRIHFVSIVPEEQGKKLAKPLLSHAMQLLVRHGHRSAYLTTQTTSWRAIRMYLDFGFRPRRFSDDCPEGWAMMEAMLGRPLSVEPQ